MTLDEMKDYMRGKDIILVGNGLDALEYMMGDFIDGKDLTIRFGRGVPEPVIFDRIGTNTHIWVTGQLRMDAHPEVPTRAKVLFNESRFNTEYGSPNYDHLSMYNDDAVIELGGLYNIPAGKRLSGGAITAHWLANVCTSWKTLTFINFDCFTQQTPFIGKYGPEDEVVQHAASWHLPMLKKQYIDTEWSVDDGSPAHDSATEERIFRDVLRKKNTFWMGRTLGQEPRILSYACVRFMPGRRHFYVGWDD
jgi:hypothetical protein